MHWTTCVAEDVLAGGPQNVLSCISSANAGTESHDTCGRRHRIARHVVQQTEKRKFTLTTQLSKFRSRQIIYSLDRSPVEYSLDLCQVFLWQVSLEALFEAVKLLRRSWSSKHDEMRWGHNERQSTSDDHQNPLLLGLVICGQNLAY